MAATANQLLEAQDVGLMSRAKIQLGATVVLYENTIVIGHDDGYAYAAVTPAAADHFLGLAEELLDNSAGAAGAVVGNAIQPRRAWLPLSGAAVGDIGTKVYASDNYTATKTSTNNVLLGTIKDFATNKVLIEFDYQKA